MPANLSTLALVMGLFGTTAMADMVVVNGRYVVPKDTIRGYFYRQSDQRTVFDVRWSDWSTQYRCSTAYDRTVVQAALLNFVLQLKDATSLDFGDFLESEGFEDCRKF